MSDLRLGIDLGGTKIEVIVLQGSIELYRKRIPTPAESYPEIIKCIAHLVMECKENFGPALSIGIGMPGALTTEGRVKNSNTVCVNDQPFLKDIETALQQNVRIMNDANCFALSEAVDGAAAGKEVVFGVILGTGVGGGIVMQQKPLIGCNSIAGEWGHNPLPVTAPRINATQRMCYCGKYDCVETYLCAKGLMQTYHEKTGFNHASKEISELIKQHDAGALDAYELYQHQLSASLATVINVLDPDVIVLGGGVSGLPGLAEKTQALLPLYVFSDVVNTLVVLNMHGDSSGVRGAAWLWPA